MRRGEVWWANLPHPWGRRPVLLLARTEAYAILTWVMVAPLTTTIRDIPTAVRLDPRRDGVPQASVISLDSIQTVRRAALDSVIVPLSPERLHEVDLALHFALGVSTCPAFLS